MSLRRMKPQLEDEDGEDEVMGDLPSDEGDSPMDENEGGDSNCEESEQENPQEAISKISFAALAKAAASISKDKSANTTRESQPAFPNSTISTPAEKKPRNTHKDLKRTSKHAPQEVSSKRAVARRREVVAPLVPPALAPRDPRFDDAVKGVYDEKVFKKNYSFLEGYKEDEMKLLKQEMAKTKDERKKEQLKKTIVSMQSKKQQQERKERTEELVRDHKKKERDLVKQGKKPFHLKKAEQRKMLLMDKYSKLNEKQLDKVLEKKRKRKAQKEHKNIPFARREAQ